MESLLFALNAVAPLVIMVAIGYILKKIGWADGSFAKKTNRLVFHVFLPATLFLNVYKIQDIGNFAFGYVLYAVVAILVIFLIALSVIIFTVPQHERRGALLQAAFRSNYALIGIPLAGSLFGEEGTVVASLLSAVLVPLLNMLAVISLTVFRKGGEAPSVKKVLLGIAKNPLIQAIAVGLLALLVRALFVKADIGFRLADVKPVYTVLTYLSGLSTPLALIALGAQFEFSVVSSLKKEILFGTLMRTVIVPALGIGVAYLFFRGQFSGAHFATFVAVFATPVAVSSVPMTQEMDGDVTLMGQLVVWTTIVSAFSVFLVSFLLRLGGIF